MSAGEGTVLVAVVHTPGEVRFLTAAATRAALTGRLAEYVQGQAEHRLWPEGARRLRELLAGGECEAAIETYFAAVGGGVAGGGGGGGRRVARTTRPLQGAPPPGSPGLAALPRFRGRVLVVAVY